MSVLKRWEYPGYEVHVSYDSINECDVYGVYCINTPIMATFDEDDAWKIVDEHQLQLGEALSS